MEQGILRSVERSHLSDSVANQLETAIKEGRFWPGQQLPAERQLSRELGVSRPILREALSTLAARGLITVQQGRGTFVTDHAAKLVDRPLVWLVENEQLVRDFYQARLVIEPTCAALASRRARLDPAGVARLEELLASAEDVIATDNVIGFIGLDIDFHAAIAHMTGNPFLYRMLEAIIQPEMDLRNVLHRLPDHLRVAHERHERIVAAIKAGDAEGSRQRMIEALEGPAHDIALLHKQKEKTK